MDWEGTLEVTESSLLFCVAVCLKVRPNGNVPDDLGAVVVWTFPTTYCFFPFSLSRPVLGLFPEVLPNIKPLLFSFL